MCTKGSGFVHLGRGLICASGVVVFFVNYFRGGFTVAWKVFCTKNIDVSLA